MAETNGPPVVLVVDDDLTILEIASEILETFGFQVLTAANGYAGLQIFTQKQPAINLVLLDLAMPGMDGFQVFTAIRQLTTTVPVIFSSGFSPQNLANKIKNYPATAFLQKPYHLNDLIDLVRKMLRGNHIQPTNP